MVLNDCLTINNAESEMNRAKTIGARHDEPLIIMMKFVKLVQKIISEGRGLSNKLIQQNKKIIPYAEKQWASTTQLAGKYKVTEPISNLSEVIVAYDGLNSIERNVNLLVTPATCTCLAPQQIGLPCGHVCAAYQIAFRLKMAVNNDYAAALFHPQYIVERFVKAFNVCSIVLPSIRSIRKDDTIAPNTIVQPGRKRTKRYLSILENFSNKNKRLRKTHYSTVKSSSSVGENSLFCNVSEIEEASKFIDSSALLISNMSKEIDDLLHIPNKFKTNSNYLSNDAIFSKVNTALDHLKSSLDINGTKIRKQVGLIKQHAGITNSTSEELNILDKDEELVNEALESEVVDETLQSEAENILEQDDELLEDNEVEDDPQDVESFDDGGDMQVSDLHDIEICRTSM